MSSEEQLTIVIGAGRFADDDPAAAPHGVQDSFVPSRVLEASILDHWPDARIVNTYEMEKPVMKNRPNPTPFSFVRFMVPELCRWKGWGLYLDSDMLVFADPRELLEVATPTDRTIHVAHSDTAVMLMRCYRLRHWDAWKIAGEADGPNYGEVQRCAYDVGAENFGRLPPAWHSREFFEEGVTKLLHLTALNMQPWSHPGRNPLEPIWAVALRKALDGGLLEIDDLDVNCRKILREHCPEFPCPR